MAKRVFLHIGTMKSATTYIQDLCELNVDALSDQGLMWAPQAFAAMHDLMGSGADRPGTEGAWKQFDARIRAHDGDVLVSNELLAAVKAERIAQLIEMLKPADIEVIITARDLARVIPSQWQTMTRNRHTVGWKEFVDAAKARVRPPGGTGAQFWRKQDLAAIVRRWSAFVPVEQISVVTVPPKGSPTGLLPQRFGSVFGVDLSTLPQPGQSNPALGGASAELLRRLNLRTKDWALHNYQLAFKNATARHVLEERAKHEPRVSLAEKDLKWVRRRSERMISALKSSGVNVVGDLDDLLPTIKLPKSPIDPGSLSDTEILEVAEYTVVGLARLLADLRIEYRELVEAYGRADPVDVESEEWLAFVAADEERGGNSLASRKGRYLVWREGNEVESTGRQRAPRRKRASASPRHEDASN